MLTKKKFFIGMKMFMGKAEIRMKTSGCEEFVMKICGAGKALPGTASQGLLT